MVHTFEALGVKMAVDVGSGAVHVLDDAAFALLSEQNAPLGDTRTVNLPDCAQDVQDEAWSELRALQDAGLLFAPEHQPGGAWAGGSAPVIKALCLHVSHDCNLRCKYCFASTGDFGTGRKIMGFDTARRAIDFVVQRSGPRRNIEIDFFGGEPLMAMDTVKKTVEYARSLEQQAGKKFRFTITTNGLLLDDETIAFLNREMSNVVLSLDGRRAVNDAMRPTVSGKGSFDVIVPKMKQLVAGRETKDYYVRGTFTRYNMDFAGDVMAIADEGFRNISVEPVVSDASCPWSLREEDLPALLAEYETLARQLHTRREVRFFHFLIDLEQGPCVIKRLRGCGAGCEYLAVTPEGTLYPCHQFVGNDEYKMGDLYVGDFDQKRSEQFAELTLYAKEECTACWAKFYCSGGCGASNLLVSGDIKTPHKVGCALEKKRVECALALRALSAASSEGVYGE